MGNICSSCFGSDESSINTPDAEERRRQQLEAAEKRLSNEKSKGIKNPERVSRLEKKAEERDRLEAVTANRYDGGSNLRWQMS